MNRKKILIITAGTLILVIAVVLKSKKQNGNLFENKNQPHIAKQNNLSQEKQRKWHSSLKKRRKKNSPSSSHGSEWKSAKDYPHVEKITNHLQRFRRKVNGHPPKVSLLLGKVFERSQRNRLFKFRKVLVSIETKNGNNSFVAIVNEENGRIIKKQGYRVNDPHATRDHDRRPTSK